MTVLTDFLRESLRIEGIHRDPTPIELKETDEFLRAEQLTVLRIVRLVSVYAPHARLRNKVGLNVRVGNHVPMPGGPEIKEHLQSFCEAVNAETLDAYRAHLIYETLHPFTDGNGRSGRAVWAGRWCASHRTTRGCLAR